MAVEIDVGVLEAVTCLAVVVGRFGRRLHGAQTRGFGHRALPVGNQLRHPFDARDVAHLTRAGVDHRPHRAGMAYDIAVTVGNLEIALGKETRHRTDPGGHPIVLVDTGIALHIHRNTREHPCLTLTREKRVTDADDVGTERGHLDKAVDQQGQGHALLGVAFAGGEEVVDRENFLDFVERVGTVGYRVACHIGVLFR